jgi:hypothetical protein
MKKADVDRAVRKHLSLKNLSIAIVSEKGEALRETLLSGKPPPSSTTPRTPRPR